eukprot:g4991.t1
MYVRDVVLTDESMFGFNLKEWVDEYSYSKLCEDLKQKKVCTLQRGDVVIFNMVAIKSTGKCKRSYGTINVNAESTRARPKLVVYYRSGSILNIPVVMGSDDISCTLLTKKARSRLQNLNSWAKTHHSAIFKIDDDLRTTPAKDDANNGDNKDFKGNSGKRKRDDSYNAVESLETLKPNRTQSFTALLKEIRPYHGEQYTSISQMKLKTTMQTKIYTVHRQNSDAQNILVNCGRLKPVFQINGCIEELEISNKVLRKLTDSTSSKDITGTSEYGTLYIRIDKFGQTSIPTDAPLLSLTPGSNIIKVKVSLERVSTVLLNGVSLKKLFTWKMNSGKYSKIINNSNGVEFQDDDLKVFLAWQMLSSIMNTQVSIQKDLHGRQKHRLCFLVHRHVDNSVDDTSYTNALPELVDMKLL